MALARILPFAKEALASSLRPGDIAIDATAGNGYDTLFLAEQVGAKGRVYAFDVQARAIASARARTLAYAERISFICDSHANLARYVQQPIRAAVFNLGYLPGADHALITRPDSTVKALEAAEALLSPGGLLSVAIYPGHEGGRAEFEAVLAHMRALDPAGWRVAQYGFINQDNDPPSLLLAEKQAVKNGRSL